MAQKLLANIIKDQFSLFLRYFVRIAPIVVILGTITWFFLLRSPGEQTNTGSSEASETIASASQGIEQESETKVTDNPKLAEAPKEEGKAKEEGKLPETGPAGIIAIAVTATAGGTLFWEWRLRRNSRQA
jgi:hypothetical protein